MKRLLFASLTLLAGCNSAPEMSPAQVAVTNYLQKNANDPASYQPVRWGKEVIWRQRNIDSVDAIEVQKQESRALQQVENQESTRRDLVRGGDSPESLKIFDDMKAVAQEDANRLRARRQKLQSSTDTTYLGRSITHTFRSKNKLGALVLDSANFLIKKGGEIVVTE